MEFDHTVITMTSSTLLQVTLDIIIAFDTIFAFVILLVALLTSSPVMWRKERLWDFSILLTAHLSILVTRGDYHTLTKSPT
jgi:hypothetical protein